MNNDHLEDDSQGEKTIWNVFDQLCFAFGDQDAVHTIGETGDVTALCYFEIQEYAKALAAQLHWRYRPSYVLVDCHGWAGAEIVALLATIRIQVPFVPVSVSNQHSAPGRLGMVVERLSEACSPNGSIVAITCCQDDQDPVLGVFQRANVHSIIFLDPCGNMRESISVPADLPAPKKDKDDLYLLFTSGTSGEEPKAVVGSHRSTQTRIQWFHSSFEQLPKVAKRTPLTFVDAIAELLGTLLTQDSILVASLGGIQYTELADVGEIIRATKCSQISMLPSQLELLLRNAESSPECLEPLQRIIISGEPCTESLWDAFKRFAYNENTQRFECELLNLYGQTETSGDCVAAVLTSLEEEQVVVNHTVTIGAPLNSITNIEGKALTSESDGHGPRLVELVISGSSCLSNGYLGGGQQDTENFVWDDDDKPISFATGDTGFYMNDLWYVQGRKNDVIKINGEWTCPAAVESAFMKFQQQVSGRTSHVGAAVILDSNIYMLVERSIDKQPPIQFSREQMRKITSSTWNLIPKQIFECDTLPRTDGTGKIDRGKVHRIVNDRLLQKARKNEKQEASAEVTTVTFDTLFGLFLSISGDVLGDAVSDASRSFTNLGGDSARAVSLHYELRRRWWPLFSTYQSQNNTEQSESKPLFASLKPIDILNATSMRDIWRLLIEEKEDDIVNERPLKQARSDTDNSRFRSFLPTPTYVWDKFHSSIDFAACVDANPVILTTIANTTKLLAACQEGVVQLIEYGVDEACAIPRPKVINSYHDQGWRVSVNMTVENGTGYICSNRHPSGLNGLPGAKILAVSMASLTTLWCYELSAAESIRSSPIIQNNHVWVVIASTAEEAPNEYITAISVSDSKPSRKFRILLPFHVSATPIKLSGMHITRLDGSLAKSAIVFASVDWETGLVILDVEKERLMNFEDSSSQVFFPGQIGPIYKSMSFDSRLGKILLSDAWGSVHLIDLGTSSISTLKISNYPLSPPVLSESYIFVGGYDGQVHCIDIELKRIQWSQRTSSTIYSKPLLLSNRTDVVVATTGGDILMFNMLTGKEEWRYRTKVGAEIWSDPREIPCYETIATGKCGQVCFGARDSRLHFIELPKEGLE